MLSRLSTKSGRALSRAALRASLARSTPKDARRAFVQPSGADRASVVEVPSAYQEDTAFSPRVGQCSCLGPCVKKKQAHRLPCSDMFGFKLEASRREGGPSEKARPIYLDMQVSVQCAGSSHGPTVSPPSRPPLQWTPGCWTPCYLFSPTSTATLTVGPMPMGGRPKRRLKTLAR